VLVNPTDADSTATVTVRPQTWGGAALPGPAQVWGLDGTRAPGAAESGYEGTVEPDGLRVLLFSRPGGPAAAER